MRQIGEAHGASTRNCDSQYLGLILQDLHYAAMLASFELDEVYPDTASNFLCSIISELERLRKHPRLFKSKKQRSRFFKRSRRLLRRAKKSNSLWQRLENEFEQFDREVAFESLAMPGVARSELESLPWEHYTRNRANRPSKEAIADSAKGLAGVLTTNQTIPNGGFLILERWRTDIEGLIRAMVQVSLEITIRHASLLHLCS